MRDLMAIGAMLMIFSMAVTDTFIAYLLWGWSGLIGLDGYLYGFMARQPYVQIFAMMTLVMVGMRRDTQQIKFELNRTSGLLIGFACHGLLVATFAFDGIPTNWQIYTNICKTFLFCLIMPMLVTSRLRIHAIVISIILALSFHGLLDGLKFLSSGGSHNARGVRFGDNNLFALVLCTVIPLLIYVYKYSNQKWLKPVFLGLTFLVVLAVVATKSRGGLITLLVIAAMMIWKSKRKVAGLMILTVFTALVMAMASDAWFERMNSVQDASGDNSFMTRVAVWKKSTAIALDHPLFGGGFNAVESPPTFQKYRYSQGLLGFIDTPDPFGFVAHSIYFQVMGDTGFLGFFIYIALWASALRTATEINKIVSTQGEQSAWAADLANALKISLIAFLTGGALLSAAYYDISFVFMMLLEVVKQNLLRNATHKNKSDRKFMSHQQGIAY